MTAALRTRCAAVPGESRHVNIDVKIPLSLVNIQGFWLASMRLFTLPIVGPLQVAGSVVGSGQGRRSLRSRNPMHLGPSRMTKLAIWSRRLGTFAVPVVVLGTVAHRLGAADGFAGPAVLAAGAVFAVLGLVLGLSALLRIWYEGLDGARAALLGLVVSILVLIPFVVQIGSALTLPPLTQVSTDVVDPPAFRNVAAERPRNANPIDRLDPDQARLQAEHYPTVVSLRVEMSAPDAYALALELVQARGWRILDRVPAQAAQIARAARPATIVRGQRQPAQAAVPAQAESPGRIEAVARTRVFGFRDDVVIRIVGSNTESRIDMRSASRIGWHDFGTNARRVVDFLTEFRDRAAER